MQDPLAVIFNENFWQVYKVSPLFNLKYSELKLKQYATKIRQELATDAASPNSSLVIVESLPLLKYVPQDPSGLQITVKTNDNKVVYVAIFLSWGNSTVHTNMPTTHLPYMLEHGSQGVGDTVKNSMRKMFDCTITPFNFTKAVLVDLMFNLVECDTSRHTDPFVLGYKTPQAEFKNKAMLTFEIGDMRTIWNNIKEKYAEDEELNYTSYAYQLLQSIIFIKCELDVTKLDFCEVVLPKAVVKCRGVVKMKTPEIINSVLNVLNDYY